MTARLAVLAIRSPMFDAQMPGDFRSRQEDRFEQALICLRQIGTITSGTLVETAAQARRFQQLAAAREADVVVVVPLMAAPPLLSELAVRPARPVVVWDVSPGHPVVPDADQAVAHAETGAVGTLMQSGALAAAGHELRVVSVPPDDERARAPLSAAIASVRSRRGCGPTVEPGRKAAGPAPSRVRMARVGRPPEGYSTLAVDSAVLEAMHVDVIDVAPDEVARRMAPADQDEPATPHDRSRRMAVAIRSLADEVDAAAVAINCHGGGLRGHDAVGIVGCLAASADLPVACTADVPTAWILSKLAELGRPGLYCEPYSVDDEPDAVLLANCGIGKRDLAAPGSWREEPSQFYPGRRGRGTSVAMAVTPGPATFLSVVPRAGRWTVLASEGVVGETRLPRFGGAHAYFTPQATTGRSWIVRLAEAGSLHHGALTLGPAEDLVSDLAGLRIDVVLL